MQKTTKKILISILGKGQFNKNKKSYDYQLTQYQIENNEPIESKLVSDILRKHFLFEKIYIVGTEESLWNIADEFIGEKNYEKVFIPYGKNENEFWKIFEKLTKLDVKNSEIYFDITHGFRSIPIFISTLLNFFTKVRNAKIKGVYYGIFEAKENGITPVVNILPFLEMNRYIDAFYLFKKYSDGREIADIIKEKFSSIPINEKKEYGKIRQLSKELEFYSKSIGFSAVKFYHDSLERIEKNINQINKIPTNLKAIEFLIEDLERESKVFDDLTYEWEKSLESVKILYNKNRYAQALTILRETVLTYLLEADNFEIGKLDYFNEELREQKLSSLLKKDSDNLKNKYDLEYFEKEFIELYQQIRELRNRSNHAFIKKDVSEKTINKSVDLLKEYIIKFENLSKNNKIFKNAKKFFEDIRKL